MSLIRISNDANKFNKSFRVIELSYGPVYEIQKAIKRLGLTKFRIQMSFLVLRAALAKILPSARPKSWQLMELGLRIRKGNFRIQ